MIFFSHVCGVRLSVQSYKKVESEPKLSFVEYLLMTNDYKYLTNALRTDGCFNSAPNHKLNF
jgi:hypothetical protein